jgi:ABC-type lipoprotein export system ATPase subunit
LAVIGGLDRDWRGEVEVAGCLHHSASDAQLSKLRATTVGFVFQDYCLLEGSSCQENVELPRLMADPGPPRVARHHALELLDRVGLGGLECEDVASLSGGERQRVAIARALINSPSILLCDEPTGNLDRRTAHMVLELLIELRRERQLTVVVATHDPDLEEVADRVLDLADGRLQERPR